MLAVNYQHDSAPKSAKLIRIYCGHVGHTQAPEQGHARTRAEKYELELELEI